MDYESLSALNPRLIYASVSGFGQTGPLRHKTSFDFIAQAYSGVMHMTGDPDGPPTFVGLGVGDTNAGFHAFAGIGYALYRRDRTGQGCHIDISMVDALFHMQETAVHAASMTDGEFVPMRQGRHYQPLSPAGSFKAPQGWIVILCTQGQIDYLWEAMGRPELGDDPRFVTNDLRLAHRGELDAAISEFLMTVPRDTALDVLWAHDVIVGPVNDYAEVFADPQVLHNKMVVEVDHHSGPLRVTGVPVRLSENPGSVRRPPPGLGEHTAEVLKELGFDQEFIDRVSSGDPR
jgi:crotonobetainyl-CoA:carnitine CoA-transferase CaiB-like acyl-CoA transferase